VRNHLIVWALIADEGARVRRREFMWIAGGRNGLALAAHAQQGERVCRIGVLVSLASDNAEGQARVASVPARSAAIGWTDSRNVRIDIRSGGGDDVVPEVFSAISKSTNRQIGRG